MAQKHGVRYPWNTWFQRSSFTLKRHKHYVIRSDTMAQQVRNAASRQGLSVSVSINDDGLSLFVVVNGQRKGE